MVGIHEQKNDLNIRILLHQIKKCSCSVENGNDMEEILEAFGTAIKLIVAAVWYLFLMLPLASIAFIIGVLLIPADFVVLIISFGKVRFQIFTSFMHAMKKCLTWYADSVT